MNLRSQDQSPTIRWLAACIGSPKAVSSILNGRTGINSEMALRLSIAFDTTPESWLNQQVQYDRRQAGKRRDQLKVTRLNPREGVVA